MKSWNQKMMSEEPYTPHEEVLTELRRHKTAIAEEHGFDVRSLAKDLQQRQKALPQLITAPDHPSSKEKTA